MLCINCYEEDARVNSEFCPACYRSLNGLPTNESLDGDGHYDEPLEPLNFNPTDQVNIENMASTDESVEEYINSDEFSRENLAKELGVTWDQLVNELE
jgi:hypothetical protein